MRQIISTALVALIVGAVAGASVGVFAQDAPAPEQAIIPAGLNADKIDGRHAVGHRASRAKRAGKLVATNKRGQLPSNIVKPAWRLILGKPAAFRDGKISWGEVQGKPPGFADGVDDAGYISATQPATYTVAGGGQVTVFADSPIGTDVDLTIIPEPGRHLEVIGEYFWRGPEAPGGPYPDLAAGMLRHEVYLTNSDFATPVTFKVRTRVYNSGIAPAALQKAVKRVKVGVTKKGPGAKRGMKKRR